MKLLEDEECGALIAVFLTTKEHKKLRCVCRRWMFTCSWLQHNQGALALPKKSELNMESRRFYHTWTNFIKDQSDEFLKLLVQSLPAASREGTYALKMGLCESTNTGVRPSFDNASARTGYTIDKINRVGNFPGLLLAREMGSVRSDLFGTSTTKKHRQVALYGGGPGYDSIGLAFLLQYLRVGDVSIHTNVYDNEPGWEGAVAGADLALRKLSDGNESWAFKPCDITEAVDASINEDVATDVSTTDLFMFSFVCVENFRLLRDTDYVFLRSLFLSAQIGSYFVFTDSTHRLWPILWDVARESAVFRVWVPHVRSCHYVLVLKKLPAHEDPSRYPFYDQAMAKLATFSAHLSKQLSYLGLQEPDAFSSS